MDPLSTAAGALAAGALLLAWDRSSSAPEPWLIAACGLILATASWGAWRLARLGSDGTLSVAPPALVPAAAASRCEDSIARCLLHSRRGILEANDSFRRLLGYGPGQGWDERGMEFHLQRDWWQGFERAALSDGVVQGRFTEVVTLTGVSLTLDVSARVLERDHGFWLMEILLREPSASDAVSLSRRQEQERYTRLIHNLQEVLFEVDPHGRFEFLNPSWKTLVGREADESLGLSMAEFAAQEDREEVGSLLLQLRERRQDFFYRDLRFLRHPRGEERWAACFIKVRLDARGEVQGMTGTLTDITERKELELSLRGAREEAESAITAKDDFLAVISHEIRTPMNAVLGLTYLLLETTLNAEQKDLATTIQTSGQTLLALLNDLLDFSRIESGSLRLDTSDFAIRELIQRSMHLLSARAQEKKLALDLSIAEGVPGSVSGDAARFQQVMLNLVGNAIKFTDRGVVTVRAYRAEIPFDPPTARAVVLQAPPPSPS
ncbi:MAG: PAS domain S-box protein, partial [Verrucomicrobia bacterium]|nr:PAS domain S-box protein [Verrucomicrobiota bacterium]